jgi:hypothetical protein
VNSGAPAAGDATTIVAINDHGCFESDQVPDTLVDEFGMGPQPRMTTDRDVERWDGLVDLVELQNRESWECKPCHASRSCARQ